MKKTTVLLLAVLTLFSLNSFGQRTCAAHDHFLEQINKDPRFKEKVSLIENHTRFIISQPQKALTGTITIPVHVIVVYASSSQNISDAQIQSQISVLNEDYAKLNSDWPNTPSEFYNLVTDAEIQFSLASIERHSNSRTSWGTNDLVKSTYPPYSPNTHLNMWVCNIGGGILGYAQFPGGNPATDGIVISPQYFGSSDYSSSFYLSAPFDKGRTATHEVGHWLNLRHIWGDGACTATDYVDDTPSAIDANYGCPSHPHYTCNSNDMFMNYMDYVDDQCMFMFSNGQKDRMRAIFEPGGPRESFVSGGDIPCSIEACDGSISLSLTLDNYPGETSWTLTSESGAVIDQGYNYNVKGQTITKNWTLDEGKYTFTINDSYGDGICCAYGNGSYSLTDGCNAVIQSGGNFGSSASVTFCVPGGGTPVNVPPVANANGPYSGTEGIAISFSSSGSSDSDGSIVSYLWNFGDGSTSAQSNPSHTYASAGDYSVTLTVTDDDGASDSDATSASVISSGGGGTQELSFDSFESGWGNWTDGGGDCSRYTGGSRAWDGSAAIDIQDNSGTASSFYLTNGIDVHTPGYTLIEVEFYFYAYSMETNEDFWVQYYDGSAWRTVASYASGTSFNNNTFYVATVTISESSYNFPTNMRIRFMCDASSNTDDVYIDHITISGSSGAARVGNQQTLKAMGSALRTEDLIEITEDIKVYPNPAQDELILQVAVEDHTTAFIYSTAGILMRQLEIHEDITSLDISDLNSGLYLLKVQTSDEIATIRFVKE